MYECVYVHRDYVEAKIDKFSVEGLLRLLSRNINDDNNNNNVYHYYVAHYDVNCIKKGSGCIVFLLVSLNFL